MRATTAPTALRRFARDDSGMALATVMIMSALLFMLATTILMLVSYRETQTAHATDRQSAMHLADAGVNEYMYQLSQNYEYYKTPANLTMGPTVTEDGQWIVTVTPPDVMNGEPMRIKSVGTLANGYKRTVSASVRFPTFADYVVLVDQGPYSIGTGATFAGRIRCNGDISNSGTITGMAEAAGTCSWGTSAATNYPGGYKNKVAKVDFSQLTTDLNAMKATAQNSGSYYPLSGTSYGYEVVLNGAQATVSKITAINTRRPTTQIAGYTNPIGHLTTTLVGTAVIPADGVFFFDDQVHVSGNYNAQVTIATSKTMLLPANLGPTNAASNYTCGLVAQSHIYFPYWYENMPTNHVVQAATLSQTGNIGQGTPSGLQQYTRNSSGVWSWTSYTAPIKNSLTLKGSRAMIDQFGFSGAYSTRSFQMDSRLQNSPPPMYPQIRDGSLAVASWTEH